MRFDYWFLRYYKYYAGRKLIFDLCLIVVILSLGFTFYFFGRSTMAGFFVNHMKTEVSKLKSLKKSSIHDVSEESSSGDVALSRIPKSCFSSDTRGCVCYDQHTIVIKDFPVDRCRDIVNGFARF